LRLLLRLHTAAVAVVTESRHKAVREPEEVLLPVRVRPLLVLTVLAAGLVLDLLGLARVAMVLSSSDIHKNL
jgi:hypothetical protein